MSWQICFCNTSDLLMYLLNLTAMSVNSSWWLLVSHHSMLAEILESTWLIYYGLCHWQYSTVKLSESEFSLFLTIKYFHFASTILCFDGWKDKLVFITRKPNCIYTAGLTQWKHPRTECTIPFTSRGHSDASYRQRLCCNLSCNVWHLTANSDNRLRKQRCAR